MSDWGVLDPSSMMALGLKKPAKQFGRMGFDPASALELGGDSRMAAFTLNAPGWNAETDRIPFTDDSLGCVMSFHFLEHIKNLDPLMRECERVLKVGGTFFSAVPYYKSQLAFQDPDHKRFFTEETFEFFCKDRGYKAWDGKDWNFKMQSQFIGGVVEKNLMLFTVLEKI